MAWWSWSRCYLLRWHHVWRAGRQRLRMHLRWFARKMRQWWGCQILLPDAGWVNYIFNNCSRQISFPKFPTFFSEISRNFTNTFSCTFHSFYIHLACAWCCGDFCIDLAKICSRNQDFLWGAKNERMKSFFIIGSFNKLDVSLGIACIQGQDEGTTSQAGTGSVTRYFHNPITGNCETFQYRGSGGNANNFESREQCESYCKTCTWARVCLMIHIKVIADCSRGDPEIIGPVFQPFTFLKGVASSCTANNNCGSRFECKGTWCCPKTDFICSRDGGFDYAITRPSTDEIYDKGSSGGNSRTFARYSGNSKTF